MAQAVGRALRYLVALAALLLVVWSFIDVGVRIARQVAGASDRPITLTVLHWGNTEEEAIVEQLIAEFERTHPEIGVERLHANSYDAKLKTMLAAGTPPDLFYLRYEDVADFADQGMVLELEPFLDRLDPDQRRTWIEDFYPVLLDAFRWNAGQQRTGPGGKLIGIPKDFTTLLMYVNLDLFERAGVDVPYDGWTWAEYREAMSRIRGLSEQSKREVWGGVLKTWPLVLRNVVWTFGGRFFGGPDGTDFLDVRLDEPEAVAALEFIRTLRFEDGSVYNATGISENEDELFRRGHVGAIGPLGRWMTPQYRQVEAFDWDVVPLPHAEGQPTVSGVATVAWAISSGTEHPEAAFKLLRFLTGREGQRLQAQLGLAIPSMKSVAESEAFLSPGRAPAHGKTFLDLIDHSRIAHVPRKKEFDQILGREMKQSLAENQISAKQAAEQVEAKWLNELKSPLHRETYPRMPWGVVLAIAGAALAIAVGVLVFFARRQRVGSLEKAEERTGWMFVSPWVAGFLVFVIGPMLVALLLALTKWSAMAPLSEARFVGLDNFVHMFAYDNQFSHSLWVTVYYTLLFVPAMQIGALLVALLMNAEVKGIGIFRTVYFVPSVVTGVALTTLWIAIFDKDQGVINDVIAAPGAVLVIVAALVGLVLVLYLAGEALTWSWPRGIAMLAAPVTAAVAVVLLVAWLMRSDGRSLLQTIVESPMLAPIGLAALTLLALGIHRAGSLGGIGSSSAAMSAVARPYGGAGGPGRPRRLNLPVLVGLATIGLAVAGWLMIGRVTVDPPDWFGRDGGVWAVPGLVIMTLWGVGGGMVIYLAGLKNIPDSLYEAARIDGASPVRQFFTVTLPMLSPLIFFQLVMGIIGSFQVFTQAYVITNSTGGSNEDLLVYVLYLYDQAFRFHNMGYASALAWVLFVILMVLTLIVFRSAKRWVHYEGLKS